MDKKRNLKIGLVFACTIVVFVLGMNFLKGRGVFSGDKRYFVSYENINGLIESSPVLYNGFKVGVVSKINIDFESNKMIVAIDVRNDLVLGANSVAKIVSTDFLGSKAIRLEEVVQGTVAADSLVGKVELDLVSELNKKLAPLQKQIETLVFETNQTMHSINAILNEDTQQEIRESFSNIKTISNDIAKLTNKNRRHLDNMIKNGSDLSDSLKFVVSSTKSTISGLNQLTKKMNHSGLDTLIQNLSSVSSQIKSGSGSIGQMIYDDAMITKLNETMHSVNVLVTDFKNHPERYVNINGVNFGKKNFFVDVENFVLRSKVSLAVIVDKNVVLPSQKIYLNDYTLIENKKSGYWKSEDYQDFSKAKIELQRMQTNIPYAKIVAFKKGKIIDLDKAFK
ncbi:MAG: MlaD family protein [Prolixibacteraceae bacterium]|jgi:phospholipid/cholesterol/gamma-HCH transport system substrate-binding protein|nr:MlaD family protein [Prolixibacteraceae bacterium]